MSNEISRHTAIRKFKETSHGQFMVRLFGRGYRLRRAGSYDHPNFQMKCWKLFDANGNFVTCMWDDEFIVTGGVR